jgi:hypothetical protein
VRVIEQARLWFREGTSDKVYEVDLVEVVTGQFVVNFRYGRRGGALKDGTKTPLPVDAAKARSVFAKLVDEKLAGGYQHAAAAGTPPVPTPTSGRPAPGRASADDGDTKLIGYLRLGARSPVPLGPVLWRVADKDMKAAEPVLLELLPNTFVPSGLVLGSWRHLIVFALVRCGSPAAIAPLLALAANAQTPQHLKDLANVAVARIEPARAKELGRSLLPAALLSLYDRGDAAGLARAAEERLATSPLDVRRAAIGLFIIDDAIARPALLAIARVARLSNTEATIVRALFRVAEARRDGELYALLARRIDAHTSPGRPFGEKTRRYLRRRVARVLRRLGRVGSPDYVLMASAILLGYDDEDGVAPKHGVYFGHDYDRFAPFHAFNEILFKHSPRYQLAHQDRSFWKTRGTYKPGGPPPPTREEAFPALWDRAPHALWNLIGASGTLPVQEFATRALRANPAYTAALRDAQLADVLGGGHPLAQRFAFDLARTRPLTTELARGALASDLADAHQWVMMWVDQHAAEVVADPELIAIIVTGKAATVRDAALRVLRGRAISDAVARSAAMRAVAILLGLSDSAANAERAAGAVSTMLRVLEAPLREISADVLRDLVSHPLAALGELAGELIMRHAQRDALPVELIEAMLASPHATVRTLGGRLLAQTPPEIAKDDLGVLELFALSGNAELREATRTLLGEVARRYPDVGRALADRLVDALLRPQPIGAPAHVVSLLRTELAQCLPKKPAQTILRLIGALSPHARDAGGLLLHQLGPDDIGLDDVSRLAGSENVAIRQGAWSLARASVDRYRVAPVALAKLLDSPWEDTRTFAISFIRDEVGADKLGADAIITICDSIRPEVQDLGKQMLYQQFKTEDGGRYLTKLAEHPSTNMQLLVTTLLDQHATDVEKLKALTPFFATVLSQVNRGHVAKERVMAVLRREAARSAEAARVLAPLLDRQSATAAITQKHPIIATMVDIRHLYPDVPLPVTLVPPKGAA